MQCTINLNDFAHAKPNGTWIFVLLPCSCTLVVFVVVVVWWPIAESAFRIYYYDLKVHKALEGDSRISLHNWHNQPKAGDKISRRAAAEVLKSDANTPDLSISIYLARPPKVGRSHKEALQLEVLLH